MKRFGSLLLTTVFAFSSSGLEAKGFVRTVPVKIGAPINGVAPVLMTAPSLGLPMLAVPTLSGGLSLPVSVLPTLEAIDVPPRAVRVRTAAPGVRYKTVAQGVRDTRKNVAVLEKNTRQQPGTSPAVAARNLFDVSEISLNAADAVDASKNTPTRLPRGLRRVRQESADTPEDIDRLIRSHANSHQLIRRLKRQVRKRGSIKVRNFEDADGRVFTTLDIGSDPQWVQHLPMLEPHERAHIKKILKRTSDVQVLVREEGKTPDLIVDGVMMEIKVDTGRYALKHLLENAEAQLAAFNRRHMITQGAIGIDMSNQREVPVAETLEEINAWAGVQSRNAAEVITVYAGKDIVDFRLNSQGKYAVMGDAAVRDGLATSAATADFHMAMKAGRFPEAHAALTRLERSHAGREHKNSVADQARKALRKVRLPNDNMLAPPPDVEPLIREIVDPPNLLRQKGIKATITVYGSARTLPREEAVRRYEATIREFGKSPQDPVAREEIRKAGEMLTMSRYYEEARKFGALVAQQGGGDIAIVTGGGPGIMEAANRGAFDAGGPSVGYNIVLDFEQSANTYITPGLEFEFDTFSTRKMSLRHDASALVYFPGGFGTMDEFFEVITLIQTSKLEQRPMVLVGKKDYWDRILNFDAFQEMGMISPKDLDLIHFVETAEEAWAIVAEDMNGDGD
ncbi:MAG: TIGR00730 family Rossman fold protein [Elusimicrobia bacterium]|nr:MAG: TIGR00730 family Rossman fold protein [Elusimicrobiota bacterium]